MVSVVIPMYNSENTIIRTLESVLNQSYKGDIEVIIVNDGSTDKSLEVLQNYIDKNNIKNLTIIDKKNGGVSTARNAGMHSAKGEYIALLDSDDLWLPEKLERQMVVLKSNPDIDFIGTNRNGEYFKRFLFKKFSDLTIISARLLLYKVFFVTPTVVFKTKLLNEVGLFDESQRYAEEGNFWIRFCKDNKCVLLNESLVLTGDGKPHFGHSGLSSNLKEMEKGELKNLKLAYQLEIVNMPEYLFLKAFSLLKYIRRVVIVKSRR